MEASALEMDDAVVEEFEFARPFGTENQYLGREVPAPSISGRRRGGGFGQLRLESCRKPVLCPVV